MNLRTWWIALILLLAAAHEARADVVVFTNGSPTFQWNGVRVGSNCPNTTIGNYLDIERDSTQDGNTPGPTTLSYINCTGIGPSTTCYRNYYAPSSGAALATGPDTGVSTVCLTGELGPYSLVRMFLPGETIGPSATWSTTNSGTHGYACSACGSVSLIRYPGALGVRITIAGQTHYGFVAMSAVGLPVAWGYESTPNTPIQVPYFVDGCASAFQINKYGLYPFDTSATTTDGMADANCSPGGGSGQIERDLWFSFVAPESGEVEISTVGLTSVDTKLAVYTGANCPFLTLFACSDNDGASSQSTVRFTMTAGTAYRIRIGNAPGTSPGSGALSISLRRPAQVRGPIVNPANGSTYYAVSGATWQMAQAEARSRRGHLVTINDADENAFVQSTFGDLAAHLWMGLNDSAVEGAYAWVSTQTPAYTNWAPGSPVSDPTLDYARLDTSTGQWSLTENQPALAPFAVIEVPGPHPVLGPFSRVSLNPNVDSYYFRLTASTWADADALSVALGGRLVKIDNVGENSFVASNLLAGLPHPLDACWIGLTDRNSEGNFSWVGDSFPAFYLNWQVGAPDNNGNEDYVVMTQAGTWNDIIGPTTPPSPFVHDTFGIAEIFAPRVAQGPLHRPGSCHTYYILHPGGTWGGGELKAQSLGGHLVTINDREEELWLMSVIPPGQPYYIGYVDPSATGGFRWADGADTTYSNWNRGIVPVGGGAALEAGRWVGTAALSPSPLPSSIIEVAGPACPCDWDTSTTVDSSDFFAFLEDFFANAADINCDQMTDSSDFFNFLACFFAGC